MGCVFHTVTGSLSIWHKQQNDSHLIICFYDLYYWLFNYNLSSTNKCLDKFHHQRNPDTPEIASNLYNVFMINMNSMCIYFNNLLYKGPEKQGLTYKKMIKSLYIWKSIGTLGTFSQLK